MKRQKLFPANNVHDTFERIWRGGMPEVQDLTDGMLATYFDSYVETYLLRGAVDDNAIQDTEGFRRFLRACAALTGELLSYSNLARANLTFYRDRDGREIDLVVEEGRMLHPLEEKKATSPGPSDAQRFKLLDASDLQRGPGGIICMCEKAYPLTDTDSLIPSNIL